METAEQNQEYRSAVQETLSKPLLPALIAELKAGRAGDHDYIPIHVAITQANRVFGFGNWTTEIIKHEPAVNAKGVVIGYQCVARVRILPLGAQYDGYGFQPLPVRNKVVLDDSHSHDTASKGAESDAVKRALRYLGDTFGNSLYEKEEERQPVAELAVRTLAKRINDYDEAWDIVIGYYREPKNVPINVSLRKFYQALEMQTPEQPSPDAEPDDAPAPGDREQDDRRRRDEDDDDDERDRNRDRRRDANQRRNDGDGEHSRNDDRSRDDDRDDDDDDRRRDDNRDRERRQDDDRDRVRDRERRRSDDPFE